jgi:hypothetical protein
MSAPLTEAEETRVLQITAQLVDDVGRQLAEQKLPPPVLWYVMGCAERVSLLRLEYAVAQDPSLAPAMQAAREQMAALIESVNKLANQASDGG